MTSTLVSLHIVLSIESFAAIRTLETAGREVY